MTLKLKSSSSSKKIRGLVKQALSLNCVRLKPGGKHRLLVVNNRKLTIPSTPRSEHRSFLSFRNQLRKLLASEGIDLVIN